MENDFDIDFTVDFPHLAALSHFERCLIRLYHRMFIARYAQALAERSTGMCVVTNRTVYDSEAYIHVYRDLGWITAEEYRKLSVVLENIHNRPYAVVLNPPLDVLIRQLEKRRVAATRATRDEVFASEDAEEFLVPLRKYFETFKNNDRILYLEDDGDASFERVMSWSATCLSVYT